MPSRIKIKSSSRRCFTFDCEEPIDYPRWFCQRHMDMIDDETILERRAHKIEGPAKCVRCGKKMVLRKGPRGFFWACSGRLKDGCMYVRALDGEE